MASMRSGPDSDSGDMSHDEVEAGSVFERFERVSLGQGGNPREPSAGHHVPGISIKTKHSFVDTACFDTESKENLSPVGGNLALSAETAGSRNIAFNGYITSDNLRQYLESVNAGASSSGGNVSGSDGSFFEMNNSSDLPMPQDDEVTPDDCPVRHDLHRTFHAKKNMMMIEELRAKTADGDLRDVPELLADSKQRRRKQIHDERVGESVPEGYERRALHRYGEHLLAGKTEQELPVAKGKMPDGQWSAIDDRDPALFAMNSPARAKPQTAIDFAMLEKDVERLREENAKLRSNVRRLKGAVSSDIDPVYGSDQTRTLPVDEWNCAPVSKKNSWSTVNTFDIYDESAPAGPATPQANPARMTSQHDLRRRAVPECGMRSIGLSGPTLAASPTRLDPRIYGSPTTPFKRTDPRSRVVVPAAAVEYIPSAHPFAGLADGIALDSAISVRGYKSMETIDSADESNALPSPYDLYRTLLSLWPNNGVPDGLIQFLAKSLPQLTNLHENYNSSALIFKGTAPLVSSDWRLVSQSLRFILKLAAAEREENPAVAAENAELRAEIQRIKATLNRTRRQDLKMMENMRMEHEATYKEMMRDNEESYRELQEDFEIALDLANEDRSFFNDNCNVLQRKVTAHNSISDNSHLTPAERDAAGLPAFWRSLGVTPPVVQKGSFISRIHDISAILWKMNGQIPDPAKRADFKKTYLNALKQACKAREQEILAEKALSQHLSVERQKAIKDAEQSLVVVKEYEQELVTAIHAAGEAMCDVPTEEPATVWKKPDGPTGDEGIREAHADDDVEGFKPDGFNYKLF